MIEIPLGARAFPAYRARAAGNGPRPGMLFFHGSDGYGPQHARLAEDFAGAGVDCLVPVWFGGASPYAHWDGLTRADLTGLWGALRKMEGVDPETLYLAGASRGGGLAVFAASLVPEVRGVVNYFGLTRWEGEAGVATMRGLAIDGGRHLSYVRRITAPILSFHGEQDSVVPAEDTRHLARACRRFGVRHAAHFYPGVDHSFIWVGNERHRPEVHRDAWDKTLAFLRERRAAR